MIGNIILFGWPLVVAILFSMYSRHAAILASIIVGYLLLPEQLFFNLPILPTLEKHTIPALSAFLILLMIGTSLENRNLSGWLPRVVVVRLLMLGLIAGSFLTVLTNGDPLSYGPLFIPALRPFDAFSTVLSLLVSLLPFFLARKYLAYPEQQRAVLLTLAVAGALYAFLALYEVRMSPQLNNMLYGFFPHSFLQHIRGDGFRPIVFLNHGLWLSIFFAMAVLAAFGLSRAQSADRKIKYLVLGTWLLFALIMSKSLGALAITMLLLPLVLFVRVPTQILASAIIASTILLYPALRGGELIPTETILGWAQIIDPERAGSLSFRFFNEDILLEKAQERPLFGWGGFGRNLLYDEAGFDAAVTDGYWVYSVGIGGWVRFASEFGLLCLPAIFAFLKIRKDQYGLETSVLLLILSANLIDLIPNATITPITWLLAGAVWGRIELGRLENADDASVKLSEETKRPAYTRFATSTGSPSQTKEQAMQ
ncbi:hypothetical protein SAMN05444273_11054 [Litoreibacter ascidiaceicola]|uniref:O-Antigen ligase n=1 Tax=Litoreibacter ascidiaceicola TaxID=1486859 RepID=A0A1M5DW97_9RHOB|nr:hypothetical protein [Litoreibacter ascidiaceicola]SHF71318.1 hypothetical protein SAMN05444273_11054 [Litoreibacter ascidiaceicola]